MKIQFGKKNLINRTFFPVLLLMNCFFNQNQGSANGCVGSNSILCVIASNNSGTGSYSIAGTISGLTTEGFILQNDSADDLTIQANSNNFTFPIRVTGTYSVTIKSQPQDKICAVSNGSGIARSNISDIKVYCCYKMGGSVQGCPLNSPSLVSTLAGVSGATGKSDGTLLESLFFYPYSLTTDGINFYIADTNNYTIRKVDITTGTVSTIAGIARSSGSVDGPGTSSLFFYPGGITTDGSNLYIADTYNYTIRKIEISSGVVTTLAGSAGLTGSTDGTGSQARFYAPFQITTDNTNLYVTDAYNNTIRKIVISTGVVTTIAGTAGVQGSSDGVGTSAQFYKPYGITTDGTNLFVTDAYNHTIRKIEISTGVVTTFAGIAGTNGYFDGTGTSAIFNLPTGITCDGTYLYFTDTFNQLIRRIEISTGVVNTLTGTLRKTGSTDGEGTSASFYYPFGIITNGTNLYVGDTDNNVIRQISPRVTTQ